MALVFLLGIAVVGYVLGSISFAVMIAKSQGVNIFELGSGNPGATNVLRNLGKKWGYLCFALDALKGVVAAGLGLVVATLAGAPDGATLAIIGLVAAIVGHSFSVFIGFRGGKGVATTVGGLLVIMPLVMLAGIAVWLVAFFATRYVSLGSILLGASLPVSAWFFHGATGDYGRFGLALMLAIVIVVRHKANIQRLVKGEENRAKAVFGGKP